MNDQNFGAQPFKTCFRDKKKNKRYKRRGKRDENLYLDLTRSDQFSCDYRIVWNQAETTSTSDKAPVC